MATRELNGTMADARDDELRRLKEELEKSKKKIADQARENGAMRASLDGQRKTNGEISMKLSENAKWNGKMSFKKLVQKHGGVMGVKFSGMSNTLRAWVWPRMKIMPWDWKEYSEDNSSVCQVSMRTLRWGPGESRKAFWDMLGVSICIYVFRSLRDQKTKDVKMGVSSEY